MPPRGRSTFTKRQKEQKRLEKRQEKLERRAQRKQEKPVDGDAEEMSTLPGVVDEAGPGESIDH